MADAARILYVITDLQTGGVPLHLHRLACVMRDRGYTPAVASLAAITDGGVEKAIAPVAARMSNDAIDVHDCGGRGGWDFRVIGRLARIIRATEPDLIHALLFHANVAARRAARKIGFPRDRLICEIQTVEVERRWHLLVDRWTHRGCRLTIGNSPSVVDHLARAAGIPRDKLRLVRGGIDPAPWRAASPVPRDTLGLGPDDPLVLWAGRLDPIKGLVHLVDAFAALAEETTAHLCLAGTGPLRGELARRIDAQKLRDRVHLLGVRDDMAALLKAADVFAFPSRTEGLPNAVLEAMAAGCPVVATDVPGCRDLVIDEKTGLLVPYGDRAALAAAIRRLLGDRGWAARLAASASAKVDQEWHVDATLDAYDRLYQEVLAPADRDAKSR